MPSPTSPGATDGVEIRDVTGQVTRVDRVVIATHADQALGLLADPSDAEVTTLKQFAYSSNVTVLHTDRSVLPDAAQARASLELPDDVLRPARPARRGDVLDEPAPGTPIAAQPSSSRSTTANVSTRRLVAAVMDYEHPIYTPEAVRAQSRLEQPGHRPHRVCRGLPRLGLPRGRLPLRRRGRPTLRGGLVSAAPLLTSRRRPDRRPS